MKLTTLNPFTKEDIICTLKALAIVVGGYVAINAFFILILLIGYASGYNQ